MKDSKLSEEYLKEVAKFFQRAKEECLIPGKDMLTQGWTKPTDIYWAASGVVENSCKAYRIYRRKQKIKEVELDQHWREEIRHINNESITRLFNSVFGLETKAKENSITKNEAENCLKESEIFMEKIIETIPTSDRIIIGV